MAQERVWKATEGLNTVKRVVSNCKHMQSNPKYDHLLDLNARGVHLEDLIYQKLARNLYKMDSMWAFNQYLIAALCRIGNRTMTEQEYLLIGEVSEDNLVDWTLDERLKGFKGGANWNHGPFYCHKTPRNKEDPFYEARELGY